MVLTRAEMLTIVNPRGVTVVLSKGKPTIDRSEAQAWDILQIEGIPAKSAIRAYEGLRMFEGDEPDWWTVTLLRWIQKNLNQRELNERGVDA